MLSDLPKLPRVLVAGTLIAPRAAKAAVSNVVFKVFFMRMYLEGFMKRLGKGCKFLASVRLIIFMA